MKPYFKASAIWTADEIKQRRGGSEIVSHAFPLGEHPPGSLILTLFDMSEELPDGRYIVKLLWHKPAATNFLGIPKKEPRRVDTRNWGLTETDF